MQEQARPAAARVSSKLRYTVWRHSQQPGLSAVKPQPTEHVTRSNPGACAHLRLARRGGGDQVIVQQLQDAAADVAQLLLHLRRSARHGSDCSEPSGTIQEGGTTPAPARPPGRANARSSHIGRFSARLSVLSPADRRPTCTTLPADRLRLRQRHRAAVPKLLPRLSALAVAGSSQGRSASHAPRPGGRAQGVKLTEMHAVQEPTGLPISSGAAKSSASFEPPQRSVWAGDRR